MIDVSLRSWSWDHLILPVWSFEIKNSCLADPSLFYNGVIIWPLILFQMPFGCKIKLPTPILANSNNCHFFIGQFYEEKTESSDICVGDDCPCYVLTP